VCSSDLHTAQKPKNVTYKEVADTMNALRKGNFSQQAVAKEVGKLKLYTTPPQRTWVGLTDEEKDGKRVLENGLLFNAAEVQAWELGVDYAGVKLKEKNT